MDSSNITAIVLTLNEEKNIKSCLRNLSWVDRIILVDSGSTDKTIEYATEFGCDIHFNSWSGFSDQRNWALDHTSIKTDWVVFIDADEEITPRLRQEILTATNSAKFSAYYLCYKVIFLGKWVKRSSNYPVWHPRIVRIGKVRFKNAVTGHGETWEVNGKVGYIREPYIHYCFSKGLSSWFEKHNRLSSMECESIQNVRKPFFEIFNDCLGRDRHKRRQVVRELSYYLPFRPLFRFTYQFILKGGILDGPAGWTYCSLYFAYEIMISAKIKEKYYREKIKNA